MKVVQTQSAVLSNHEVLTHVQSIHERYKQYAGYTSQAEGSKYRALASVVGDVTRYLLHEKSPLSAAAAAASSTAHTTAAPDTGGQRDGGNNNSSKREAAAADRAVNPRYNSTTAHELLRRLEPFRLTKSELLIILNLRPKDVAALDAMVEECDERFSDQQQEEIVNIVAEVLGSPKVVADVGESDDNMDVDGDK